MAGGSNSVRLRHYNERVVLDAIRRQGKASKAEIARVAHLTPPAVAAIVDSLVDAGFVKGSGKRFGGKGQPSAMFEIAPDGVLAIGLHIGRRGLGAALMNFAGQALALDVEDYDHPEPELVRRLGNGMIARFIEQSGEARSRLVGVGVSAPYFIGGWDDELGLPAEMRRSWRTLNLAENFFETDGLSVIVENDASAAALPELMYGAGRQYQDFLHISIGTFVGGGLVLNGALQTGANGNTAAFGPFPVTPSALASVPKPGGKFDVLLHRASIYTLLNHLRHGGVELPRVRDLHTVMPGAAALVAEWQDDCADALAQAIIGTVAVIDVQAVVIDGLLPRPLVDETVSRVRNRFADMVPPGLIEPEILAGRLGPRVPEMGAGLLPIYSMFSPHSDVLLKQGAEKKPLMVGSTPFAPGRTH